MNSIRIKGYLKNNVSNEIIIINTEVIKKNKKILYTLEDAKYELILNDKNSLYLIRENEEIKSIMNFVINKHTTCDYTIKRNNINVQIEIETIELKIEENKIYINYQVENADIYEYLIEIEE